MNTNNRKTGETGIPYCNFALELSFQQKSQNMSTSLLVWSLTVSAVAIVVIIAIISKIKHTFQKGKHSHHCLEWGSEREMFFIPGDPDPKKPFSEDYED